MLLRKWSKIGAWHENFAKTRSVFHLTIAHPQWKKCKLVYRLEVTGENCANMLFIVLFSVVCQRFLYSVFHHESQKNMTNFWYQNQSGFGKKQTHTHPHTHNHQSWGMMYDGSMCESCQALPKAIAKRVIEHTTCADKTP